MFSSSTVTYTSVYIILSPSYIADSDPDEDEEDPEEDPADHPADGGDNNDNESVDDGDDDNDVEKDEEDKEEDEHLASPDPSVVLIDDLTKSRTTRTFVRHHTPQSPSAKACITEFAAALPSSLPPPPENTKSLKDSIRLASRISRSTLAYRQID
ncbi:hypothetical protein Tco_0378480 [Tanacetum coccineum]